MHRERDLSLYGQLEMREIMMTVQEMGLSVVFTQLALELQAATVHKPTTMRTAPAKWL